MGSEPKNDDEQSPEETARRRDEVIRRMASTRARAPKRPYDPATMPF
jgi:hypothetical protein